MVFEAIAELVAERVEKDVSEITPESSFKELGIDSLDTVEMLMNLEDKTGHGDRAGPEGRDRRRPGRRSSSSRVSA